jgi:hypothetical protein
MQKSCNKCNNIKDLSDFYKKINSCKKCHKSWRRQHYLENKQKTKLKVKEYQENNKIYYRDKAKSWQKNNKSRHLEINKKYQTKRRKSKRPLDIKYCLAQNLRGRLREFLNNKNLNKKYKFSEYIGCNVETLKKYIESQFYANISWNNYGVLWHIDHIKPLMSAKTEKEIYKLCHYTNLQPLTIEDHKAKTIQDIKNKKG